MEELKDLRDIRGLDAISNWPLAWGWWVLIGLLVAGLIVVLIKLYRVYRYRRSWQYGINQRLSELNTVLMTVQDPKPILQSFAVQMRKIGLATAERNVSASLTGRAWLDWLQQHDPNGYAWSQQGNLLVNAQYKDKLTEKDSKQIAELIQAAQRWVEKC